MRTAPLAALAVAAATLVGCSDGKQTPFADLYPVKGTVTRGGKAVSGGVIQFKPESGDKGEFMINSEVGSDGAYNLSTVRSNDSKGERKPGAPAGKYKVTYLPGPADQTAGGTEPVELKTAVTVEAKENNLPIDLPKK